MLIIFAGNTNSFTSESYLILTFKKIILNLLKTMNKELTNKLFKFSEN